MGFLGKLKQNRFWIWNRYTKELTLKRPLSYVAIFCAVGTIASVVAGLALQFFG